MQASNHTRNKTLAEKGTVANRPWLRMRGLIGRSSLEPGEGLLLLGTKGIHTIGMRFPIDVLFLNDDGWAVHLIHALRPFRVSPFLKNSAMVLELPAGTLRETGTQVGDWIAVVVADAETVRAQSSSERVWTETEETE
ncbi:hypothetical protein ANRL3_01921 [Anaerolineae bacterium]|nr:hypothetical protein ANRL3_01921 [Anaerolineae bacterium]